MASNARTKKTASGTTLVNRVHELPFNDADARVFVTVAETGSFTAAAARLELTPSAVSKAISRLESTLNVQLLARTTRALHLTDEGFLFRDRCAQAFHLLAEAVDEVSMGARSLAGTIRLGLPPLFGTYFAPHALHRVLALHPKLRVDLVSTMHASDIVDLGLDLAIVVGPLPDSSFVARPLGHGQFVTVASPAYLAKAGTPRSPDELASGHRALTFVRPDGRDAPFSFGPGENPRAITVEGQIRSDDMHHLAAMATLGLGVAQLPLFVVAREIEAGTLVRILREHEPEPKLASLVFPSGRVSSRRVRAFADVLLSTPSPMIGVTPAVGSAGRGLRSRPRAQRLDPS